MGKFVTWRKNEFMYVSMRGIHLRKKFGYKIWRKGIHWIEEIECNVG